jgi:hypothetical protein
MKNLTYDHTKAITKVVNGDGEHWYNEGGFLIRFRTNGKRDCYYYQGKDDNNILHRLDGPAASYQRCNNNCLSTGKCELTTYNRWYIDGVQLDCHSQEEFEQLLRLKAFW